MKLLTDPPAGLPSRWQFYRKSANPGRLAAGAIGKLDRAETEDRTVHFRTPG
jgi:hypothetical protein